MGRHSGARRRSGAGARTGIGAAAVTTVVAIAASVHALGGGSGGSSTHHEEAAGPERAKTRASRSDDRAPLNRTASLDSRLRGAFPMQPKLKLGGAFAVEPGHEKAPRPGTKHYTYRVDVEKGLHLDGGLFARFVQQTLNDKRSWAHAGQKSFERISTGHPDFVVTLASPGTVATWCAKAGLDTAGENVSCDTAVTPRVMINAYRWAQGSPTFGRDLFGYREMLVNHEVGHRLGHNHEQCATAGALAPVMMQQTKTLTTAGRTCKPNPWPFPA